MKDFFQDLLYYNNHFNNRIIDVLKDNPHLVSEKCIKLFSHVLNAHSIWNYNILRKEKPYERWHNHLIGDCHEINKKNHDASTQILETIDLDKIIQYSLSTGQVLNNSVRDILFQIINHSTYHRGQIATEFRQCGLEPLLTDYIVYKMK